jgi:hypothetical protein
MDSKLILDKTTRLKGICFSEKQLIMIAMYSRVVPLLDIGLPNAQHRRRLGLNWINNNPIVRRCPHVEPYVRKWPAVHAVRTVCSCSVGAGGLPARA